MNELYIKYLGANQKKKVVISQTTVPAGVFNNHYYEWRQDAQ